MQASTSAQDYGAVASVGDTPKDMSKFASSDCYGSALEDCTARDNDGRQYVFFDGALSRISMSKKDLRPGAKLPAGILFGEDIEQARRKASSVLRIRFNRAEIDGRIVYSSELSLKSAAGIRYSVELLADDRGQLEQVVERTDF